MKNKVLAFILALVLIVSIVLGACAEPVEPVESEFPATLTVCTTGTGTSSHVITGTWGAALEQDVGTVVRIVPEASSATRAKWLRTGTVDMFNTTLSVATDIVQGQYAYATRDGGAFPFRIAWLSTVLYGVLHVMGDSDIQSFDDIKPGTRYATWVGSPEFINRYHGFRAWLQMSEEELIMASFTAYGGMALAVKDGQADIGQISPESALMTELLASPRGIRIIDMPWRTDPEGAKRYTEIAPAMIWDTVPEGFGPPEVWGTDSFYVPMTYYCREDASVDQIYNLVKWLAENYGEYSAGQDIMKHATLENWRRALDIMYCPVHDGAIKYMTEIGLWTDADEARQEYNLRLHNWYSTAYKEAISFADEQGVKVDPQNEDWISLWENYKKQLGIPPLRPLSDEEIQEGLEILP